MKRMKKVVLLSVKRIAYQWKLLRLYYLADRKLYELQAVCVMPDWYYRWLYHACMWLMGYRKFHRLADRAIHTIPYHVRFKVA
ncbi:MAG: hypothetical protein JJV98_17365 [Desulfosarcina sp.]|nr:hypothetical protein [Desulfobacterales bacterium]